MSEKADCQFCCWLRQQAWNIAMVTWFLFCVAHSMWFMFIGNLWVSGPFNTEIGAGRAIALILFHLVGLVVGGMYTHNLVKTCNISSRRGY